MSKKKVSRSEIKLYFTLFQNLKSFHGMSGKGQVAILEDMEVIGKLSEEFTRAEERRIKTLQTPSVKQAHDILQSFQGRTDLSEGEIQTMEINSKIAEEAENELEIFKQEYYSVMVDMPTLEKISKEDFYVLAEKNTFDISDESDNIGIGPQGLKILKSLIY